MKNIVLLIVGFLLLSCCALGQGTTTASVTATSQNAAAPPWWPEAKALAQKVADLKRSRYEVRTALFKRLDVQARTESEKEPRRPFELIYNQLLDQAAPEFAAIEIKFVPQIESVWQQYISFLRQHKPSEPDVLAASKDSHPDVIYREKAKYTEAARQKRQQGRVIIQAVFHTDGTISDFRVLHDLKDGLSEEAIKAAQEFIFLPALKDGNPVNVRMSMEFVFKLL